MTMKPWRVVIHTGSKREQPYSIHHPDGAVERFAASLDEVTIYLNGRQAIYTVAP